MICANIMTDEECFNKNKRPQLEYKEEYGNISELYEQIKNDLPLAMNGRSFEFFCADLLKMDGFEDITITKASADHGVDILARKEGKLYAVQCKCISHTCSNKAVQEIVSANTIYKADRMIVICNTTFSTQARILASTNNVILYSIGTIKHILDKYFCDFYDF